MHMLRRTVRWNRCIRWLRLHDNVAAPCSDAKVDTATARVTQLNVRGVSILEHRRRNKSRKDRVLYVEKLSCQLPRISALQDVCVCQKVRGGCFIGVGVRGGGHALARPPPPWAVSH